MAAEPTYSVKDHFRDKDKSLRTLYDQLLSTLREFGPVSQEAKKTSIHLVNHSALAGVRVRKEYLLLNFKSDRKLKSKRLQKSEQLSSRRYHHELKLESQDDFDAELKGWLQEAYDLSG
jgi:hypothetical protein